MAKFKYDIWIIEDEKSCRFVYSEILHFRYSLRFFEDLKSFVEVYGKPDLPDLLIADLRLPDGNFLNEVEKKVLGNQPTIVISSLDDLDILRSCYEKGAKEYMTKPFGKSELIVKIERHLRLPNRSQKIISYDYKTLMARNGDKSTILTLKEGQFFSLLQENDETPVNKAFLLKRIYGRTSITENTLDVHISKLRRKLSPIGLKIKCTSTGSFVLEPEEKV